MLQATNLSHDSKAVFRPEKESALGVLALSTPIYAIADANESFALRDVPTGNYELRVWIEGVSQSVLDKLARSVHLSSRVVDLGDLKTPVLRNRPTTHANKFGWVVGRDSESIY